MKTKRRLFALTCSLLMLLLLPANAYAAGVPDAASGKVILPEESVIATTTISEFDIINTLKNTPEEKLLEQGYSQQEIEEIQEFSFEEALLERAQYSETQLRNMGYDDAEIATFKQLQNNEISSSAVLASNYSSLTVSVSVSQASTTRIDGKFSWSWDAPPFATLLYDAPCKIACAWNGSTPASVAMNTFFKNVASACIVEYYSRSTNTYSHTSAAPFTIEDAFTNVYSEFTPYYNSDSTYAKSGYMRVAIVPATTTGAIGSVGYAFSFAIGTILFEPSFEVSVGYPSGGSMGISLQVKHGNELARKMILIQSNGSYDVIY